MTGLPEAAGCIGPSGPKGRALRMTSIRNKKKKKSGRGRGRKQTMNTATAANVAGQGEKDRDKVEKRRALGRGLESLLPGPRVVAPAERPAELRPAGQPGAAVPTQAQSPVPTEVFSQ